MAARANIVRKYASAEASARVSIICRYYGQIDGIIDGYIARMTYTIMEEKEYNFRSQKGDLGVRVQSGGMYSDPTGKEGVLLEELEKAIRNCDFSGDILEGIDNPEEVIRDARTLHRMKVEHSLYSRQLGYLDKRDRFLYEQYLNHEVTLEEIAEKYDIQYNSAMRRIDRIKKVVMEEMLDALSAIKSSSTIEIVYTAEKNGGSAYGKQ